MRPRPPQRGAHGAHIEIAAVTDDGGAAVSQDAVGGTRLWPSLDGSLEPIVVHAVAARELVIGRADHDFVIATLDAAGALELIRIAATGEPRSHAQVGGDVQIDQIVMTKRGVLALRADQTLALIAPSGIELARLVPPGGERIVSIVARGGHAIALLQHDTIHARSIELDPVHWGDAGPTLPIDRRRQVALSPDGAHLAVGALGSVAIVDLATGLAGAPICAETLKTQPPIGLLHALDTTTTPLGFIDNTTLACRSSSGVTFWSLDGRAGQIDGIVAAPELVSVGNGIVVTAERASLLLTTPTSVQYLGYRSRNVTIGPLLVDPQQLTVQVDRDLHERRRPAGPYDRHELEVLPLDDRDALVSRTDDRDTREHHVSIVDTARQVVVQTVAPVSTTDDIRYEPTTHLLALTEEDAIALVSLEPISKTFGAPLRIVGPPGDIHLTDPDLARGAIAVVTHVLETRTVISEIRRDGTFASGFAPAETYQIFGNLLGVDRAGHVYVGEGDQVSVYTSSPPGVIHKEGPQATRIGRFDVHGGRSVIRPNHDGTAILVLGDNRARMLDVTGKERWMLAVPTALDLGWIDDVPCAVFLGGIAKLDPITGKLGARSCGWGFGLSPVELPAPNEGPSVCDEE